MFDAMQSSADEFHQHEVREEALESLKEVIRLRLRIRAEDQRLDAEALVETQDELERLDIHTPEPDLSAKEDTEWMLLDASGADQRSWKTPSGS